MTPQTFNAMKTTTSGILQVINFLLGQNFYGILTGNFQSDPIEKRFGLYRVALGSNYHVDHKSVMQAEKKIRLSSLIDLSKSLDDLKLNLESLREEQADFDDDPQLRGVS